MTTVRPLALVLAAAVLAGCTGTPAPTPTASPSPTPAAAASADPDREALTAAVADLADTLAALRVALEDAASGAPDGLDRALVLLAAEPAAVLTPSGGGSDEDTSDARGDDEADDPDRGPAPILPGPRTSREESIRYGDLLTRTLGAARGAGSVGEPALRFLADPLAGDLGAWQRAPDDQLAAISRAAASSDLAATETAVLALDGEAPRALAWVVHGLTVPGDAPDAAGRALAHLAVIDLALDQLT